MGKCPHCQRAGSIHAHEEIKERGIKLEKNKELEIEESFLLAIKGLLILDSHDGQVMRIIFETI